jgi:hypothetical protein
MLASMRKKCTLAALLEIYARHLEARGASCVCAVQSLFRCYVRSCKRIAQRPAQKVTPHEIAALMRRVVEEGKERSAGLLRSYLYAAYELARKAPYSPLAPAGLVTFRIEQNPVAIIPSIPVRFRDRVLSPDEMHEYLSRLGNALPDLALKARSLRRRAAHAAATPGAHFRLRPLYTHSAPA